MYTNMIVSGILTTSLLLTPTNNVAYANSNEVTFNKINNEQLFIMDKNYIDLKEEFKTKQNIINRVNERFDRIEERYRQEEERNSYNIDFVLTYYSRHPSENGGHNCTCIGTPLREGIVANNYYPIGTKLELEDGRIYVVEDRGGTKHFNNYNRLDVFIDTYDVNYVNSLGVTKIKGRIIY